MDLKALVLATIAGGVSMWALAGVWHKILAVAFYTSETEAKHEGLGIIFLAYMVLGLIMAYLYPLVERGGITAVEGLRFGIIIGLLWVFPHGLAMAGAHDESISYVFKNAAWHMVEQGAGGIVIAYVFAKFGTVGGA